MICLSDNVGRVILDTLQRAEIPPKMKETIASDINYQINDARYSGRVINVVKKIADQYSEKYGRNALVDALSAAVNSPSELVKLEAKFKNKKKVTASICNGCGRELLAGEMLTKGSEDLIYCAACSVPEMAYCGACGTVHGGLGIGLGAYGPGCKQRARAARQAAPEAPRVATPPPNNRQVTNRTDTITDIEAMLRRERELLEEQLFTNPPNADAPATRRL